MFFEWLVCMWCVGLGILVVGFFFVEEFCFYYFVLDCYVGSIGVILLWMDVFGGWFVIVVLFGCVDFVWEWCFWYWIGSVDLDCGYVWSG